MAHVDCDRERDGSSTSVSGITGATVTPEMAEAGARILRERLDASYYWMNHAVL